MIVLIDVSDNSKASDVGDKAVMWFEYAKNGSDNLMFNKLCNALLMPMNYLKADCYSLSLFKYLVHLQVENE